MALAPSLLLFGVPSRPIIAWSASASESQERPRSRSAISPLTFAAALSTPRPSYRDLSPSRSSTASRDPVDAPDGTPARAVVPSASLTVTASVGRARESRISSADSPVTSNNAMIFVSRLVMLLFKSPSSCHASLRCRAEGPFGSTMFGFCSPVMARRMW